MFGENTNSHMTIPGNVTHSGIFDLTNTTQATDNSGDTGALRVEGGASIAKNLYAGGDIVLGDDSMISFEGNITSSGTTTLGDATGDYTTIVGNITASGIIDHTNTTEATDASGDTGALRIEGGASIAKKLYVGGAIVPGAGGMMRSTPVVVADADTTLTFAANGGRTNVIVDVAADRIYTLPTPTAAGQYFHFIYGGAAADAHAIAIRTLTTDNSVYFKGSLNHGDTNGNNTAAFSDGDSNEMVTIDLIQAMDLHVLALSTTVWYIWGSVTSATAPVFAN